MILNLSPVRCDESISVVRDGEVLIINGVSFDFSRLADGSTLPLEAIGSDFVVAPVERTADGVVISLMLPHAADASEAVRFPGPIYNPANGPVPLPGMEAGSVMPPLSAGVIDWSIVITKAMKEQKASDQHLAWVIAQIAAYRGTADAAIAPLQDAVDLEDATDAELVMLKEWKRYRVALSRLPDQVGYPSEINWPVQPT